MRTVMPIVVALLVVGLFSACTCESEPPAGDPIPVPAIIVSDGDDDSSADKILDKKWLKDIADDIKPLAEDYVIDKNGAGRWKACMPAAEISGAKGIQSCSPPGQEGKKTCLTPYRSLAPALPPLELWMDQGRLVRVLVRSLVFRSPQNIAVGDTMAHVLRTYIDAAPQRDEAGRWFLSVEELSSRFYLVDRDTPLAKDLDPQTKIFSIEARFNCQESAELP